MIRRALAADPDVLALFAAGSDGHRQQRLDRRVTLIEATRDQGGITVQSQRQLRHVVGADRHAVEVLEKLLGQQRVAGDLAHHDEF